MKQGSIGRQPPDDKRQVSPPLCGLDGPPPISLQQYILISDIPNTLQEPYTNQVSIFTLFYLIYLILQEYLQFYHLIINKFITFTFITHLTFTYLKEYSKQSKKLATKLTNTKIYIFTPYFSHNCKTKQRKLYFQAHITMCHQTRKYLMLCFKFF